MTSFITSFLLAILVFGIILSGPLIISYGYKLPCDLQSEQNKNLIILFGSLLLVLGTITLNALVYNINVIYDIIFYLFVVSGVLILNYGISIVCDDDKCKNDKKSMLIAGSVISFLAFMLIIYYIRNRIIFI